MHAALRERVRVRLDRNPQPSAERTAPMVAQGVQVVKKENRIVRVMLVFTPFLVIKGAGAR